MRLLPPLLTLAPTCNPSSSPKPHPNPNPNPNPNPDPNPNRTPNLPQPYVLAASSKLAAQLGKFRIEVSSDSLVTIEAIPQARRPHTISTPISAPISTPIYRPLPRPPHTGPGTIPSPI